MDFVVVPFLPVLLAGYVMAVQEVRGFLVIKKNYVIYYVILFKDA